jgi:hypothetical protein
VGLQRPSNGRPDRRETPHSSRETAVQCDPADAWTWADAVRDKDIDAAWHFIDIPRGAEGDDLTTVFCGAKSCINAALEAQTKCKKDTHADPKLRAAALRYIIHFVGDIHQRDYPRIFTAFGIKKSSRKA